MMEPSSSASFKRARLPGSRNQRPSCLVDGCTADLGKCRDYHRRHKVCEVHSKTSKVTIKGQEQRFCQQCSRFHSLVEFDEGKRSCRKRLDGHNRRRRKPQPDSLSINSGLQGFGHIPFGNPRVCAATAVTSSLLGTVKAESDTSSVFEFNFGNRNGFFHGPLPQQLSFIQTNSPSLQPFLYANPSSNNGGSSSRKMFSDALNQAIDSDRARSLLSSQLSETPEICLDPMVQSGPTSPLIPNWQYTDLAMEGEQVGTILTTDGSSNTDLHGDEMFRTRRPGSLYATGTHQTLSFPWDK